MAVLQTPSAAFDERLPELTRQLAESADAHDRSGDFPHANLALLRHHGLLALALPPALGGPGASLGELRRVIGAVARGEPSTALVLCMQYLHLRRLADNPDWPGALKRRVAREVLEQGALINSLRVEPELGSPSRGGLPGTLARRVGDGWQLSGHKLYTTGIPGLTWLAVWARSDEPIPRVGTWLVRRDSPGIRIVESWDHLGMRASGSHEVLFEEVAVPLENAIGLHPHDQPPAPDQAVLRDFAQASAVLLGALYDGIAGSAREWLVGWLRERVPASLGEPAEDAGGARRDRRPAPAEPPAARCRVLRTVARQRLRAAQGRGHRQRVGGGREGPGTERQPRPQPAQSATAALPRRALRTCPHATER